MEPRDASWCLGDRLNTAPAAAPLTLQKPSCTLRPGRARSALTVASLALVTLCSSARQARADGENILHLGYLASPAEAPVPKPLTSRELARLRAFTLLHDVTAAAVPQVAALFSPSYARALFVPSMFCLAQTCALSEAVAATRLPPAGIGAGSIRLIMSMGSAPAALLTWFLPRPTTDGRLTLRFGPVEATGGPACGLRGRW
ncbi:MAG: hypothetical protein JWP97_1099 [Labilithrix sp.]|nr:hypothetical protein [Labilithrix sp.]